jgi:multiple sugar transport system ATP-binding protein
MATITLTGLTKVYPDGHEAVQGVDLDIGDGEFMVLVGPSGCGKTTVLRMVAGLEDITAGTLKIGEDTVNDVGPKDRNIAMVFQNYALYPHMSVAGNIGFGLKLRSVPRDEIRRRVEEAAEILGLTDLLERKPGQLSGGQRQRVAMGRAIVREPAAFLMDEPLSNLDAKLRVQMRSEVSHIQRRLDTATLYVTHDQVEAMTMGDRLAIMRDGRIQQCGAPQTVYDRPVNLFVASFIGSPAMNLYEATLGEGASAVAIGSQEIPLPESVRDGHPRLREYAGRKIIVGLRPEHLHPAVDHDKPSVAADVDLVEALGYELLVHFSIDAKKVTAEGAQEEEQMAARGAGVARFDPDTAIRPSERVRLAIDVGRMYFFDGDTGSTIWD